MHQRSRFRKKSTGIEAAHLGKQPNRRTHVSLQSNQRKMTWDQDQSFCWIRKLILYTHSSQWMHLTVQEPSSCLCFLAFFLTLLRKLFSGILFPAHQMVLFIITSIAILLDFSATSRGHQQPFPFLCCRASCYLATQGLGLGQGLTTQAFPHYLGTLWKFTV